MSNQYENSFNYYKGKFGKLWGQPVAIYTVDYTAQDQEPVLLYSQKMYKVEVKGPSLVQNPLPNAAYYCVHGAYNNVNTGYILVPLRSDSNTPRVTMISKSPFEEMTAFRTSRKCQILNGETVVYDNCYFDFATTVNYPNSPLHKTIWASEGRPTSQIVMYKRNLRTSSQDIEGLLIKEIDVTPNVYWKIEQVTDVGYMMELTVTLSDVE